MALEYDSGLFLRAQQEKNKNFQQRLQDIQGIGQGLGNSLGQIAQMVEQQKKKQLLDQIVMAMKNQGQPQLGPQMPGVGTGSMPPIQGPAGYAPPGAGSSAIPAGQSPMMTPPTSGMGAPSPDQSGLIDYLMMQYDPQAGMKTLADRRDPLKQSMIQKNLASATHLSGIGGGQPTTSVWRNTGTGDVTDVQPQDMTGYVEYKVKPGQALQTVTNIPLQKERAEAMKGKTEAWNRSIDNKQVNELVKRTGLTQKQQSALQMNNLRADRAIEILGKPNITWQELALGEIDLAGIMQGGVPQVDEVKNTHFPGWQQKAAEWRTYATGHPTENVPEPIRKKVLDLINGVVTIDNRFLEANSKFSKNMLGKTITGGIKPFEKSINEMTSTLQSHPSVSAPASSGWSYVGQAK